VAIAEPERSRAATNPPRGGGVETQTSLLLWKGRSMSALRQKRTLERDRIMSALPQKRASRGPKVKNMSE
jgi:hypothetical protein